MGRRSTIFLGTPTTAVKFFPERGVSVVYAVGLGRLVELADKSCLVEVLLEGYPEGRYTKVCSLFEADPEVYVGGEEDQAEAVENGSCSRVEGASDLTFWQVRTSNQSFVRSTPPGHGLCAMISQLFFRTQSYPW